MSSSSFDYGVEREKFRWDIPEKFNIARRVLDHNVEQGRGDSIAIYLPSKDGETQTATFGELKAMSERFGNVLRALGIKKGDRLLFRTSNSIEFMAAFLGAMKIGAVPIPSSTMYRGHEISYRANDSGARLIVTTKDHLPQVEAVRHEFETVEHVMVIGERCKGCLSFEDMMAHVSEDFHGEDTDAEDIAFLLYTSGTTGNPKGVVHVHRWLIGNAEPIGRYWTAYKSDDVVGHVGELNWVYTLGNGMLYPWYFGVPVVLWKGRFDAENWFKLMDEFGITNFAATPTGYRMLLTVEGAEKKYDIKLRNCISAGEPLPPDTLKEWKERFGVDLLDGIGMTEVMVYCSNIPGMPVKPGSCGKPHPGHVCAAVDEDGNPVSVGSEGLLAVSRDDPGLLREYWNKPDKTEEVFVGDWFIGGDAAVVDEDGYYWFKGRSDDLIKASGYRISPFEVESTLAQHEAVLESAAVASTDPMRGDVVKAFILLREGYEGTPELVKELQDFFKVNAAPYMYPRLIEFVDELPKTQSGKTKRKVLREQERKKFEDSQKKG